MDSQKENTLVDNKDVPEDSDVEETSESDTESTDSDIINEVQRRRRIRLLWSDSEESDLKMYLDLTEFDLPVNNEAFQGTPPNLTVYPINTSKVEEFIDMFIENDLFEFIATETNRYHRQNCGKYKEQRRRAKWLDVTVSEIKKWFALIIIIGFAERPEIDDHCSTDPLVDIPIFNESMSRERFKQILTFIHFANNINMFRNANRLLKVQYLIDRLFLQKM